MSEEKKSYMNAGSQTRQAWSEMRKYGELPDDAFVTLKTVSLVLGINRNKVNQIPIQHVMLDKRKVYRKGDISQWVALDARQNESILGRLRSDHNRALERQEQQSSRHYAPSKIGRAEAKRAKEVTKSNVGAPFSDYENHRLRGIQFPAARAARKTPPDR